MGLILLCAFFTAFGGFSGTAQAQKILERFSKPLPDVALMPEKDFLEKTEVYEEIPYGDKSLSYKIRLPKEWKKVTDIGLSNYSVSEKVMGEVVRYYGPPRLAPRSRFTLDALQLEYKVSAHHWFIQYVLSNGFTLEGIKVYGERKVEALYIVMEGDLTFVVRAVAELNGRRMALAKYSVPYSMYEHEKSMQASSIASFELISPSNEQIEKMEEFRFLDVASFHYPVSWKLRAAPLRSIDRMNAMIMNFKQKGKSLDGQINIELVSNFESDSLSEEINNFKNELENKGLVFGELLEKKEDIIFDKKVEFAIVEVYEAIDASSKLLDYELWFTIASAGGYYYFVTLLSPARDDDFFVWSRNAETYKIILESLKPLDDSISIE